VSLIEKEDAARRLARALASDIRLYSAEKLQRGEDLSSELAEGRALFRTRVIPELYPVFETVLVEQDLLRAPDTRGASRAPGAPATGTLTPLETSAPRTLSPGSFEDTPVPGTLAPLETSPPSALPPGLFEDAPAPKRARVNGALLLGIVLVVAAIGWFATR
jgi:hypothetical protein